MICSSLLKTKSPLFICVLVLFLAAGPESTDAQSRSRFLEWSYQDAGALVGQTTLQTPFYVAGGASLLWNLSSVDYSVYQGVQTLDEGKLSGVLGVANELGNSMVVLPAAGIFTASLLSNDTRLQNAAFTSLQSVIYTRLIVSGLKSAFGRWRPVRRGGPLQFDPFTGHTSFPSGHAATAFALTVPWAMYYPNPVTYGLVGLSVGTSIARMAKDRHWLTDVTAGSSIGFMIAYWLSKRHQQKMAKKLPYVDQMSVVPAVQENGFMVHLQASF